MKGYIHTGGEPAKLINDTGDIVVVTTNVISDVNAIMKDFGERVCLITSIMPVKAPERRPVAELRVGWQRVMVEIKLFTPQAKRVLVLCENTAVLRVIMPGLDAILQDTHGTLFELDGLIIVPTFQTCYPHMLPWRNQDIKRLMRLERPPGPLTFRTELPVSFGDTLILDFETNYPVNDRITGVGLQWSDTERCIITENIPSVLDYVMEHMPDNLVFHGGQYDLQYVSQEFREKAYGRIRDTMLRSRARGEYVSTLKHLGVTYTRSPGNYAWHEAGNPHSFDNPAYICEDVDVTWRLWRLWQNENTQSVLLYEKLVLMMVEQTINGSAIDVPYLDKVADEGALLAAQLKIEVDAKYGCDVSSNGQLALALTGMGIKLSKTTATGTKALTAEVLTELGLDDIVEWRKARKLDTSFVKKIRDLLREDGTLPHHQKICAADTGRTSMSDFNWQQAGRTGPVRKLMTSRFDGGFIGSADLSQAELRSACYYAQDTEFAEALNAKDMHRENAAMAFNIPVDQVTDEQRSDAKIVIFRLIFGGAPQNDGQKAVEQSFRVRFPKLMIYLRSAMAACEREIQSVSAWGMVRKLGQVLDYRGKYAVGRAGVNAPIQGLASDFSLALTLRVWELCKKNNLRSLVTMGIHDAIILDIHPDEVRDVIHIQRIAFAQLGVELRKQFPIANRLPLVAELVMEKNWADTKKAEKGMLSTNEGALV